MREIEFRGRDRYADGTFTPWVYGGCGYRHADIYPEIIDGQGVKQGVEPDTIGQWTGLFDISGNRLYEGDVVEMKGYINTIITGVLIYSNRQGAYMVYREDGNAMFVLEAQRFELLGNIFDDPKLQERFGQVWRLKNP